MGRGESRFYDVIMKSSYVNGMAEQGLKGQTEKIEWSNAQKQKKEQENWTLSKKERNFWAC